MVTPFVHTLCSLEVDGSAVGRVLLALSLVLLGGWTTWLFAAEVEVSERSEQGRVQVAAVGHKRAGRGQTAARRARAASRAARASHPFALHSRPSRRASWAFAISVASSRRCAVCRVGRHCS